MDDGLLPEVLKLHVVPVRAGLALDPGTVELFVVTRVTTLILLKVVHVQSAQGWHGTRGRQQRVETRWEGEKEGAENATACALSAAPRRPLHAEGNVGV